MIPVNLRRLPGWVLVAALVAGGAQTALACETANGAYVFNVFQLSENSGDFVVAIRPERAAPGFNDVYALSTNMDATLLQRLSNAYLNGQKVYIRTDGTECVEGDGSLWGNITMLNTWENF